MDRPTVILVDKSLRDKLPFDIQHRPVIFYRTDSRSGFDELEKNIIKYVKAELEKETRIVRAPVLKDGIQNLEDLKGHEVAVLSTLLALWPTPNSGATHWDLTNKLSSLGYKDLATGLGVTSLLEKGFIQVKDHEEYDSYGNGHETKLYQILPEGIAWLRNHENELELKEDKDTEDKDMTDYDDDIPF